MATYMQGPDLSHWNTPMSAYGNNALKLEGSFCMIKATQGTDYIDPTFKVRVKVLSGQHHYGTYHYLSSNLKVKEQVDFYLETLKKAGVLNESVLCLDWEEAMYKSRAMEIEEVSKYIFEKTGRLPMIYVSYSKINLVPEGLPIWVARWREINSVSYTLYQAMRSLWPDIVMWQWSNKKYSNYFTAPIDYNITHLSEKAWQSIGKPV